MDLIQQQKEKLRTELKNKPRSHETDQKIVENFLSSNFYKRADKILVYASMADEIDTSPIIRKALDDNKEVYLPKVDGKRMTPVRIENYPNDLEVGAFNILEPGLNCKPIGYNHELDLVVVPGLAFSPGGLRLGRGGGYYDRFLPTTVCKRVALSPEDFILEEIPTENYDEPVDYIITEDRTIIAARPLKLSEKAVFNIKLD